MLKNKAVTILLSALIAFSLWFYVVTVVNPEYEESFVNIPVALVNETSLKDRGLMITSESVPTVTIRLKGNRTDLAKLNASNISLQVDLSRIYDAGTRKMTYSITYPGNVPEDNIVVLLQEPSTVTLKVERIDSKEVPVRTIYTGSVPDGYFADTENPEMSASTVLITGPESVVKQIEMACIQVDLTNKTQTVVGDYTYTLCDKDRNPVDANLITTNMETIEHKVLIQKVKEVPLQITIINGGGATEETSNILIDPLTIFISGSESVVDDIEFINLGTVDLGKLNGNWEETFDIVMPAGVTNRSEIEQATVKIEFPDLLARTFMVDNFRVTNVPAGMQATIVTKMLAVTVRGPRALMEKLTAEDITIVVDCTEVQAGMTTYKASITVSAPFNDVGEIGDYSVSVNVRDVLGGT